MVCQYCPNLFEMSQPLYSPEGTTEDDGEHQSSRQGQRPCIMTPHHTKVPKGRQTLRIGSVVPSGLIFESPISRGDAPACNPSSLRDYATPCPPHSSMRSHPLPSRGGVRGGVCNICNILSAKKGQRRRGSEEGAAKKGQRRRGSEEGTAKKRQRRSFSEEVLAKKLQTPPLPLPLKGGECLTEFLRRARR